MRVQSINSINNAVYTNNLHKKKQSTVSFKGIIDIENRYNEILKNLKWYQRVFTNKQFELKLQRDAEIYGYALAIEEAMQETNRVYAEKKLELEAAKSNNADQEKIKELEAKLVEAEKVKQIQQELMKVRDNRGWGRIAGYDNEKMVLTENFILPVGMAQRGEEIPIPNGFLFFGPTGNGKTTFAKAFAEQSKCNFIEIDTIDPKDFIGDLSEALKEAKRKYKDEKIRTIILIDEFERFGSNDGNINIVGTLKNILQNCAEKNKATFFLTTNNPQDIDSILLADSRVPVRVYLDPPNKSNAAEVFKYYLKGKTDNYINIDSIVDSLFENQYEGAYSNSRIKTIVESTFKDVSKEGRMLTEHDLIQKIKNTLPDITKAHLEKHQADIKAVIGRIV